MSKNDSEDASTSDAGTVHAPDIPPPYLKLIADCWEHIFDYLSIKDIIAMGFTCERMFKMAGWYIRQYYPELFYRFKDTTIQQWRYSTSFPAGFEHYIQKLVIEQDGINFRLNTDTFPSLKTLIFNFTNLCDTEIESLRPILKCVEKIELDWCRIDNNFFEVLSSECNELKCMKVVKRHGTIQHNFSTLFSHTFRTIEQLHYESHDHNDGTIIDAFLENHKQLKHFACDHHTLWLNRNSIIEKKVEFDLLTVCFIGKRVNLLYDQVIELIHTLYARRTFKKLGITFNCSIASVGYAHLTKTLAECPALEQLQTVESPFLDIALLTNLKELRLFSPYNINMESLSQSLTKLERLDFNYASNSDIVPFIRNAKRLKTIRVYEWHRSNNINLVAINAERNKLINAAHLTLYAPEPIYLLQKWKSKNLNLKLVRMARLESNDANSYSTFMPFSH